MAILHKKREIPQSVLSKMTVDQMLAECGAEDDSLKKRLIAERDERRREQLAAGMEGYCQHHKITPIDLLRITPAKLSESFQEFTGQPNDPEILHKAVLSYLREFYPTPQI